MWQDLERHLGEWFDFVSVFVIMQNCWQHLWAMMINWQLLSITNFSLTFSNLFQPAAAKQGGRMARKSLVNEQSSQANSPHICVGSKKWSWLGPISEKNDLGLFLRKVKQIFQLLASVLFYIFEFTDILILILVWQTLYQPHFDDRREEKLYVEGMEDEDMKKETQNLAYPPAFKVSTPCLVRGYIAMCTTWAI